MELFQLITREGISLGQIIFTALSKFEMRNTVYLPNRLKRGRAVLRNTRTHSTHSLWHNVPIVGTVNHSLLAGTLLRPDKDTGAGAPRAVAFKPRAPQPEGFGK